MGLEAKCTLRVGRDTFAGAAHLNTDRVEFRGGTRLDLPFAAIKSIAVGAGGALKITHTGGHATLGLLDRATAEKWALKIRYPKSLIDKLGVKPDSRVAVLGVNDPEFLAQAKERLGTASAPKPSKDLDFIFY